MLNFDPGQIQDEVRYGQFIGVLRRQKDERRVLIKGRTKPPNVLKLSVSRLNRLLFRGKIPARNCVEVHEKKSWLKGAEAPQSSRVGCSDGNGNALELDDFVNVYFLL